jgi:7,8-dihydro-6-hydroxymethylpterin dimethyltransferase
MNEERKIATTQSVCPVCLGRIDAQIIVEETGTYMLKSCNRHGEFKTLLWGGSMPYDSWVRKKQRAYIKHPSTAVDKGCPHDCGLCGDHRQITCTGLIEVTNRCNLHCSFCFASAGQHEEDPTLAQLDFQLKCLYQASGPCNLQLSGGEPTVRDDLVQIIRLAADNGFRFIQLNTNGIRLSEEVEYAGQLKAAGLDSVFLQFDGTEDRIHERLRGVPLSAIKEKAIENCRRNGIGVVLVPTVVPGVNVDNIGQIIEFALMHHKAVKGVHFQPVSYFGRIPFVPADKDRFTLGQLIDEIDKQTGGVIDASSLKPPGCENALCSFHGKYIFDGMRKLKNVTSRSGCCNKVEMAEEGATKAKAYVARSWSARNDAALHTHGQTTQGSGWDRILESLRSSAFSISAMAFQDAWNMDLERVRDCCIHVVDRAGKLIPFCAYNMTDTKGNSLYRK